MMIDDGQIMRNKEIGQPHIPELEVFKHVDDLRLD